MREPIIESKMITFYQISYLNHIKQVKEFLPILEMVTIFHIEIYFINIILFPMHFHIYIATKSLSTKTFLQQGNKLIHLDKYGFCVMHISHMSLLFSLLFITVMQREIIVGHILTLQRHHYFEDQEMIKTIERKNSLTHCNKLPIHYYVIFKQWHSW